MELKHINEEIALLSITVDDASIQRHYNALLKRHQGLSGRPVAPLQIPNNLLILWMRKLALRCQQCNSVMKHSALASQSIQEDGIIDYLK